MVHLCTHVCLVMHVCVYAPVIDDACGAHVCMWCMYVYLCPHVFGCVCGACMCNMVHVCICGASMYTCMYLVVHAVHASVHGTCMCIWCIYEKHLKS